MYPDSEPKVLLHTTGMNKVRFNPNLYASGKVCLSLLGTWSGEYGEKWNKSSTFLQVLVSIQSLIFVEQPYFNEPGYERYINTSKGDSLNFEYNEVIRYHTIELGIIDQILNGPIEYKEIINNHFRIKKNDILKKCEIWVTESKKLKEKMIDIYNKLEQVLNSIS
jgi:baculoviral IAP repeat-containing protein 6